MLQLDDEPWRNNNDFPRSKNKCDICAVSF